MSSIWVCFLNLGTNIFYMGMFLHLNWPILLIFYEIIPYILPCLLFRYDLISIEEYIFFLGIHNSVQYVICTVPAIKVIHRNVIFI